MTAGWCADENVIVVRFGDLELAVYNVDGNYFATSNLCTHGHAQYSERVVIDDIIECHLYQGRSHISTGTPRGAPVSEPVATYPVKLRTGRIHFGNGDIKARAGHQEKQGMETLKP